MYFYTKLQIGGRQSLFGGCQFTFWRASIYILEAEIVLGALDRKGVIPKKGGTLGSRENYYPIYSPFFARQKKRIILFFLWGDPVQNRPQNPAPAGCHFSTTKSRCEVPERGDFGEENCVGKGGADKAKKGRKDAQKKVGLSQKRICGAILKLPR